MKRVLCFSLALLMIFGLCACSSVASPEETLVGRWVCVDGPSSFSLEFRKDGTGTIYVDERSAEIRWEFTEEREIENTETKETALLYSYNLIWESTYAMVTMAGGEDELMLKFDEYTLLYEKV